MIFVTWPFFLPSWYFLTEVLLWFQEPRSSQSKSSGSWSWSRSTRKTRYFRHGLDALWRLSWNETSPRYVEKERRHCYWNHSRSQGKSQEAVYFLCNTKGYGFPVRRMNWNPKGLSDVHTCWKRTQAFNVKCGISTFQKYWCLFIILSVDLLFKLDCLIKHASTIVEHTVLCHYQQDRHHRGFWYCRRFCYCAEIKMIVSVINWPAIGFFALWQMLQNLKSCKRKC